MVNKYLSILCFILCFIFTGCLPKQPTASPTVKPSATSQIKDYVCTGEYNFKYEGHSFTVDYKGDFYLTSYANKSRMNIKKYNSQGKYITSWIPEIKKKKKNCWFSEKKELPHSEKISDIFADNKSFYLIYGASYNNYRECISHIEKFDFNGNFITAIKPEKDSYMGDSPGYITKDKNGNFYLASHRHIEKYNTNWKLQSILYPFEQKQKWYKKEKSNLQPISGIDDLIVDSQGYIYILIKNGDIMEPYSHIAKFDSSGNFLMNRRFSEGNDYFYLCAIEIDSDDNIYVLGVNYDKKYRIQKFDSSGNFITGWNFERTGNIFISRYTDMKIDAKRNVYIFFVKGTIKRFSPKQ